jgi:hypothetical protein
MTANEIEKRFAKAKSITGIDYSKFKEVMTEEEMENCGIPCLRVWSEPQAALRLGISTLTLHRARKRGEISFYRIGRRVEYSDQHIADYLAFVERRNSTEQSCSTPTKGKDEDAGV